jgi:signal transduction histidine kinase
MPTPPPSRPSLWREFLRRLKAARDEVEAAAARSGQVPAHLLRRLAVLKLAVPITIVAGGVMLWVTEQGYQRLERTNVELKASRELSRHLNDLSYLAAQAESTQAEYLLAPTVQTLSAHRSVLQQISALYEPLAAARVDPQLVDELKLTLRYIAGEREELDRLPADHGAEARLGPNPVADGTLRDAIGQIVTHERNRLDSAEAAAARELRTQRWLSLASILVGMLLLVLLLQAYRDELGSEQRMAQRLQGERDHLEAAVAERTRELSELATHLQRVAEAEKSRLARELHDELGAILTASKMDVAMLLRRQLEPREAAIEGLRRLQENLERGVQLKRRVIEGLVPTTLNNLGLVPALDALADEVAAQSGLEIVRHWPEDLALDTARSIAIFRIVQEALTNVQKHARATRVVMSLDHDGETLRLELTDNGVGLGSAGSSPRLKSHGLLGMKHRVDAFHGHFELGRAEGGGTRLRVALPLKDAPADA